MLMDIFYVVIVLIIGGLAGLFGARAYMKKQIKDNAMNKYR